MNARYKPIYRAIFELHESNADDIDAACRASSALAARFHDDAFVLDLLTAVVCEIERGQAKQ